MFLEQECSITNYVNKFSMISTDKAMRTTNAMVQRRECVNSLWKDIRIMVLGSYVLYDMVVYLSLMALLFICLENRLRRMELLQLQIQISFVL